MGKKKNVVGTLVVLFLLVGLPAISFYYLQRGYEYRKEILDTRGDYGKMPDLGDLTPLRGEFPANTRGAMAMVGWLDTDRPEAITAYGAKLDSLYQQFKDSPNLYFTTIVRGEDQGEFVRAFARRHNLPPDEMMSFLGAEDNRFLESARAFRLPEPASVGTYPAVALVDSSQTIVGHYDMRTRARTTGLVRMISSIIPLKERPDIILDRGKEL